MSPFPTLQIFKVIFRPSILRKRNTKIWIQTTVSTVCFHWDPAIVCFLFWFPASQYVSTKGLQHCAVSHAVTTIGTVSLFAKHREPAVPGVGSGGGVAAAEREPGSSVGHKAFTQQIHKLALIIIISICLLLRLCHSTVHLRLQWSKKTNWGEGLQEHKHLFSSLSFNTKFFFQKIGIMAMDHFLRFSWNYFLTSHQYLSNPNSNTKLWQCRQ